jgi:Lar family restriction alleviation protein
MTAPILPCPFCGDADPKHDEIKPGVHALVCDSCGAVGPHYESGTKAETAIFAWNARATDARCWRCDTTYAIDSPGCPKCFATNANHDAAAAAEQLSEGS